MATNPQWLSCASCEGDGKSRSDATEECAVCGGIGSLIFCSCCLSYQSYDGRFSNVCRPCAGEAASTARQTGGSVESAVEGLRAQWTAEHRRVALEELRPALVMVSP